MKVKRNTAIRDRDRAVLRQAGAPCHICGQPIDYTLPHLDPLAFVADHLVPLDAGGADRLSNKAAAHRRCNRDKSNKPFGSVLRRSGSLSHPTPSLR